jgi:hypothetical protein
MPASQAGRGGFESRLPLQVIRSLPPLTPIPHALQCCCSVVSKRLSLLFSGEDSKLADPAIAHPVPPVRQMTISKGFHRLHYPIRHMEKQDEEIMDRSTCLDHHTDRLA